MGVLVRFSRLVPLLIVLGLVAGLVYIVVSWRRSPARAKEVLITVFTAINGSLSIFFGIACLYALFEQNADVFDLVVTFFAAALIALGITRVCKAVFLKHNPAYRRKPVRARKLPRFTWRR